MDPIIVEEFELSCMNKGPKMLEILFCNFIPHFKPTELGSKLGIFSFIKFNFLDLMSKSNNIGLGWLIEWINLQVSIGPRKLFFNNQIRSSLSLSKLHL